MAVTINAITNVDWTGNQLAVDGSLTLTGNYGAAGSHGDTLSFAGFDTIKSSRPPSLVSIFEQPAPGTAMSGNTWLFTPGTTQANGSMQVFTGPTEFANGSAYPAVVLKFRAWFPSI